MNETYLTLAHRIRVDLETLDKLWMMGSSRHQTTPDGALQVLRRGGGNTGLGRIVGLENTCAAMVEADLART